MDEGEEKDGWIVDLPSFQVHRPDGKEKFLVVWREADMIFQFCRVTKTYRLLRRLVED